MTAEMVLWAELGAGDVLLALRTGRAKQSGFIDTHQWAPLVGSRELVIYGGHPNAQLRRVALGAPPAVAHWSLSREQLPPEATSSRALRSYVLRQGAGDGAIGDIVLGEHIAIATTEELDLADLLPGAERADSWSEPLVKSENTSASALRLDAVLAPLFRVSRGEAQTAIEYHFVFHNFHPAGKRTATISAGDQLVYRTKGRIEIVDCSATTRSGRIALTFRRYPI